MSKINHWKKLTSKAVIVYNDYKANRVIKN